jgi:hypothetical protein
MITPGPLCCLADDKPVASYAADHGQEVNAKLRNHIDYMGLS